MVTFFNKLLAKVVIKQATTLSVSAAYAAVMRQQRHSVYVLRVLLAPGGTRAAVKAAAMQSDAPSQKQLVAMITLFDSLPSGSKADFIVAFKAVTTVNTQATGQISIHNTWQPGHVPPLYEP